MWGLYKLEADDIGFQPTKSPFQNNSQLSEYFKIFGVNVFQTPY